MRDHATMLVFATLVLLAAPTAASAQEMRRFNPIPAPGPLPPGAQRVERVAPVDTRLVRAAVERIAATWNAGDLDPLVSDSYYDKSRFRDAMVTEVPRDAHLRVESIGGIQTLDQMLVDDPAGGRLRVSTVSVTAGTRIQLNDPTSGFVAAPGTNELILEVTERLQ
jgi:hypothetical protein